MEKESEKYYNDALNDFLKKFPSEINKYDFWIRFSQTLIQNSDNTDLSKSILHIVGNGIIKALDDRKSIITITEKTL